MNTRLEYVKCTEEYWEFVRALRNDIRILDGFIESTHITPEMQQSYMLKHADCFRICIKDNVPVGYFGVIDNDIRACTLPDYQGQGIGTFMMKSCMEVWPSAFAKVKIGNTASEKMFIKAGFRPKYTIFKYELEQS
jgi:RimJ/RimL family protein N-acetyltransferase